MRSLTTSVLALATGAAFLTVACEAPLTQPTEPDLDTPPSTSHQDIDGSEATSINGGGHILDGDFDVSFAGEVDKVEGLVGGWVVQFHDVSNSDVSGGKFEATAVEDMTFFDGDSDSCIAAMNMTLSGTFNGEPGWQIIFRAGDAGHKSVENDNDDTARVQLSDESGEVYDTHGGDFTDESGCVGSARTGLDKGNLKIKE